MREDKLKLLKDEARAFAGMLRLYATASRPKAELTEEEALDFDSAIGELVLRERFGVAVDLGTISSIWSRAAAGLFACRNSTVVVAMPGVGKTSLAAKDRHYCDIDYGNWRRRWAASEKDITLEEYVRILSIFVLRVLGKGDAWSADVIFVNELDLIPFFKELDLKVEMIIPSNEFVPKWLGGIARRTAIQAAEKLEVGRQIIARFEFCTRAIEQHRIWLVDWASAAQCYGIPLHIVPDWLTNIDWSDVVTPVSDTPALADAIVGKEKMQ